MRHYVFLFIFLGLVSRTSIAETEKLSETGLYHDFATKALAPGIRGFDPQYPLWSDGAEKSRWILLPEGSKIDSSDLDHWVFPNGTKFWKEFRFPHKSGEGLKRVETRYLEKKSGNWIFATYVWNEEESEATLASSQGLSDVYPTGFGTDHDVPSSSQCLRCHSRGGDPVLGFDPLQLSPDRDPQSPRSYLPWADSLHLKELVEEGKLSNAPGNLLQNPPRLHASTPQGRTAMGILHANCGHCHNPEGKAASTKMFLRHLNSATTEAQEPAFSTTVDKFTRFYDLPGENKTYRIKRGAPDKSAISYRMEHGSMPQIGNEVVDEEALKIIREWISGL